jgi:hypothetical protein
MKVTHNVKAPSGQGGQSFSSAAARSGHSKKAVAGMATANSQRAAYHTQEADHQKE